MSRSHLHLLSSENSALINIRLSTQIKDHPLKSLQVRNTYSLHAPESSNYSRLQILRSPAGYYLGTIYIDPDHLFEEPGSRDTTYFPRIEDAIRALEFMTSLSISGNSEYPFDLAHWERYLTAEFKYKVEYRYVP